MKRQISKFVGSRIKDIRKNKGMTQKELGKKVGVKHNTISSYEKGTNEPEQDILFKLAEVLNVSINDFFPYNELNLKVDSQYKYFPTHISAGLPNNVEGITESEVISIPDTIMGKYAGNKDIFITRINGDSMNRVMPDGSLIAVKPIESIKQLKDGDIVVFSHDHEYSVKRFYQYDDMIVFRPDSNDIRFSELRLPKNDIENLQIHGKVVLYIVELD